MCIASARAISATKCALKPDAALLKKRNIQMPQTLMFVENKGQWQGNAELGQPRLLAKLGGANVWVTDECLVYDFYKSSHNTKQHLATHLAALEKPELMRLGGHVVTAKP